MFSLFSSILMLTNLVSVAHPTSLKPAQPKASQFVRNCGNCVVSNPGS